MNSNTKPFASLQHSDPILQQYFQTVQQSLLSKSLEGDTDTVRPDTNGRRNRVVKMASSSSSVIPGATSASSPAKNITPISSSSSSVTSSFGTACGSTSGCGSGSDSDVSSLAAAAAANARTQAAAMAVAAQVGAPVSAAAAMFGGNPQALAAMAMAQAGGGGGSGAGSAVNLNMFSPQAQGAVAAGYGAQSMVATPHHPIPEFLYQLTKMLTDDNSTYIEWKEGRIFVYDPPALAENILHRYFRHSKYASFQRQLNYFGFKKIPGKGKMSPCSYVNENTTDDIRSLLFIKRKTNGPKAAEAKRILPAGANISASSAGGRKRKAAASKKSQAQVIPPSQSNFVANGGNQPYNAAFAQQQALLLGAQQQPDSGSSANHAGSGVGTASNAAASTRTSEMFHFPTDQAMQQLQQQQQQLQLLQQQKQLQQQQLQQQRQQLEILQAQANQQFQQAQQQQVTVGAGGVGASMPCPATMAMNAASATNALAGGNGGGPTTGGGNSSFESSANLASLLKTDTTAADAGNGSQAHSRGSMAPLSAATSSAFLSSLPSSNTLFPDSLSSLSLNRLLTGATDAPRSLGGGVPSMLGLSGLLSRENSLLNLAMGLPANQSSQALQAMAASAPTASDPSALPEGNDAAAQIMG
jgi:hypothetical protein